MAGNTMGRAIRRLPATYAYVAVLLATAAWMSSRPGREQARFIRHNSSNIHHLEVGKWWTLFTSGLVVDGVPVLLGIAAVAAVLGLAEWRWGTLRGFGVFLAGHLVATLLTEGAMWLMHLAHLPGVLARARDVGISYGLVATASCLLALGGRRARRYGLPALTALLTVAWVINHELADAGHLVALGLGVLGARTRWLRDRARSATSAYAAPAAPQAAASAAQGVMSPKPVSGLVASSTEDGIWIHWELDCANPWDRDPVVDTNVKSFELYRADDNGEPFKHIATLPGESAENGFIDAEIKRNRYAVYYVTTVDLTGNESAASATAAGTPLVRIKQETPGTPKSLTAQSGSGKVELSWQPNPYDTPSPSKYLVYRYDTGRLNPSLVFETDATTYSDSRDLEPGASHTYRVVGVSAKGEEGTLSDATQVTLP